MIIFHFNYHIFIIEMVVLMMRLSYKQTKILLITCMAFSSLIALLITLMFNKKVHLVCGATDIEFFTTLNDTDKILDQINFNAKHNDEVVRDDMSSEINITVNRSFEVPVTFHGQVYKLKTNGGIVSDIINKLDLFIPGMSLIIPPPDTKLTEQTSIEIIEQKKINLTVDGKSRTLLVPEGRLKDALNLINVEVNEYDVINHDLDEPVYDNMDVKIDRVLYIYVTEVKSIPFATKVLSSGGNKVLTPGSTGREDITYRQKLVNGEIVSQEEISRCTVERPIDEVRGKSKHNGSQKIQPMAGGNFSITPPSGNVIKDKDGKVINYSKKIVGECTAYTARPDALTSTGVPARVGLVAVNPKLIPYGTKMYICSEDGSIVYGYAVAADTGGALMSGRVLVDLFYNTERECYNFGRRNMAVYILS